MGRVIRLGLCAAVFLGWLGYLGYLVATRPQAPGGGPLVVSRPQVLASQLDVIALLPEPGGKDFVEVKVQKVLYPDDSTLEEGSTIKVVGLEECRPLPRADRPAAPDWSGSGLYLLPLRPLPGQPGRYEVAAIPPSPGFSATGVTRIYPASDETLAQYRRISKPPRR